MELFNAHGVTLTLADSGVATLAFSRPPMNALSRAIQDALRDAATVINRSPRVRAVVLTGGEQVFAAGADIKEMANWSDQDALSQVGPMHEAFDAVAAIEAPVIAAIAGFALGGGCELAMCADIRIAADTAVLGQPEILLGIIPGAGGTQRLTALVGQGRAAELIFTGRRVSASEALEMGLVNEVVPAASLHERAYAMAEQLAAGPSTALRAAKRAIAAAGSLAAGLAVERAEFAGLFGSVDQSRGFAAFLAKTTADFRADN